MKRFLTLLLLLLPSIAGAAEYADRVRQQTTTTGTGTLSLGSSVSTFQTFVASVTNGATVRCMIDNFGSGGTSWEIFTGVFTDAGTDTITRATVHASSNSGSAVSFGAGTKDVRLVHPATAIVDRIGANTLTGDNTLSGVTRLNNAASGPVAGEANNAILFASDYDTNDTRLYLRTEQDASGSALVFGNRTILAPALLTLKVEGGASLTADLDSVDTAYKIISTLATGTAPFQPSSTTVCQNLNADMTDGQHLGTANSPTFDGLTLSGSSLLYSSTTGNFSLKRSANSSGASAVILQSNPSQAVDSGAGGASLEYWADEGIGANSGGRITLIAYGQGTGANANAIRFATRSGVDTAVERVRCSSSGNWLIGATTEGTGAVSNLVFGGTAPVLGAALADRLHLTGLDSASGQRDLYVGNENGKVERLSGTRDRVSTQFDKTNTTLANITGLSHSVRAGESYAFRAVLYTTSNVAGGVKAAVGGTATATSIVGEATVLESGVLKVPGTTRVTALATTFGDITAVTVATIRIDGLITVNAAGTLTIQFACNAATGTSSVLVGSHFELLPIGD